MLLSIVVDFKAQETSKLSTAPGRAAQALFLEWVAERDLALAKAIHEPNTTRPYTASALRANHRQRGSLRAVEVEKTYRLRFTSLTEELSQALLEIAQGIEGSTIELAGASFAVESVTTDRETRPWAGHSTYDELAQQYLLGGARPATRWALRFASPTTFRHTTEAGRQVTVPLPLPELVFGSLVDRWNAFAPLELPAEVRRYARECMVISRYDLRTQLLRFGEAKAVGYVGECWYTAIVRDPYWLRVISLLAAYAFYAGVGQRTTVGMGQTREGG